MTDQTRAVIYAAKSTEDKRGSIKTQFADCKEMAEGEGWEVVATYEDEKKSGWSGDRGPGLVAAMEHAERVAPCVLVVQHSDRLARGDAKQARHLVEIALWAIKNEVTIRSVQDDLFADPRMALVMAANQGQRNTEDSTRKAEGTKRGIKRRKEKGKPFGPVPLGYKVLKKVVEDDEVVATRVIDPATRPVVERIFGLVEDGVSFGEAARILNGEGITTVYGAGWWDRTVRRVIDGRYTGSNGYPEIISAERFERIHEKLERRDPVHVSKRQGGRPTNEAFFLRGIAHCERCGARLYTRTIRGRRRVYRCGKVLHATGLCEASAIPAELIESHVLRHLDTFVGEVEDWLAERVSKRDSERRERESALGRQRVKLTAIERKRDRHLAEYEKLVAAGATTASIALEVVERIDRERAEQEQAIQEAQAIVSGWSGAPDVDALLDFYNGLIDQVQGRIRQAEGAADLNRALHQVLAGLWVEHDVEKRWLLVRFELRDQPEGRGERGAILEATDHEFSVAKARRRSSLTWGLIPPEPPSLARQIANGQAP